MALSNCVRFCLNPKNKFFEKTDIRNGFYSVLFTSIIDPRRYYRGLPTHNIGRLYGLEKPKPVAVSKKLQGVWDSEQHEATLPNHYDTLNFIISGYDMVLVEGFSTFVHQQFIRHKVKDVETYPLPTNEVEVKKMNHAHQRKLNDMDSDIILKSHKRVFQVKDLPSEVFPILLQMLIHNVPQSVKFTVEKHCEEHHEMRFQRKMELESEREALRKLQTSK